jgi:hypothetical protein
MIPTWLVLKIDIQPHRRIRLWIPLLLIWLLLLPFALVLAPVVAVWCARHVGSPVRLAGALWNVLGGACGTHVEIQSPDASFLIHII